MMLLLYGCHKKKVKIKARCCFARLKFSRIGGKYARPLAVYKTFYLSSRPPGLGLELFFFCSAALFASLAADAHCCGTE
jgi:hypothetical protein